MNVDRVRNHLSTACDEMLDIIHNNGTAVVKALAFLEIDTRENSRINGQKENSNIDEREFDFGQEGINEY